METEIQKTLSGWSRLPLSLFSGVSLSLHYLIVMLTGAESSPSTSTSTSTSTPLTITLPSLLLRLHRPSHLFTLELRRDGSPLLLSAPFSIPPARLTNRSPSSASPSPSIEPAPGFHKDEHPNPGASQGLAWGVTIASLAASGLAAWLCIYRLRKRRRLAGGPRDSAGHSINGDEEDEAGQADEHVNGHVNEEQGQGQGHGHGTEMEVLQDREKETTVTTEEKEETGKIEKKSEGTGQLDSAMMARLGV
ncbi:TPA_exp: Uncharacterized protein A8136_6168 [Trichophyton benhamiae CBS 112371]|uniref:Uncharacterized protein n=1 Tax=Arthroderma benhamiae (strain ATCC MYA-4681 / CBS 112371) TaxID=663331 RepID=D4AQF0_ARTBC|nr:uncharacterized protein ARB_06457 [Trichophyton benhamiae CBS 112371]EFE34694.1 hypothetical protein ARB_06457 [Trichophyton benhamiae CBS 112371]DAA77622.1 TPA_exp: Uncharacterized protein A8136_6168 [Trichophyton benhamiae CBS 112371]